MAKQYYRFDKLTVLVVDDNLFMMRLITAILRAYHVGRVLTARDGAEAKGIVSLMQASFEAANRIDIVITDWTMPTCSGPEFLTWLRSHEEEQVKYVPVIVMNAYTDTGAVERARDLGANEFLGKPMSINSISERLLAVIDKPRPFIVAPGFIGPDRRRHALSPPKTERRQTTAADIEVSHEQ
ncbi:MAG: response regulator [Proteobacteria bacterium]|nr:response regulator [Pseudomonadota bacterium]MBI3496812.1 response regulator [Pseudomonadota bacterium]